MRRIRIEFLDERVSVTARLLDQEAPKTCQAIWENLPLRGHIIHAMWSGPEVALVLDPPVWIPEKENLISRGVLPGDLVYWCGHCGERVGMERDITEVAFFYGRGAVPSMIWGPVETNLFGHIEGDLTAFADVCRRTQLEGRKAIVISQAEEA